ncbi:hypothetical protein K461DRAFT_276015 [Myriangium duriaei CBS 260.36]|uniref:Uncharacterized protein n=1 Tax=Myriangium duriaei CBS 260.36 TaxID=1168546 RepID=A0A9P4J3N3_9PEZI|nr:hypothetical protein K461DRAFT_276015 [Myriangium duriaei CBS 260.36]
MNWVGGGLQRHSRGNSSDVKKQKAYFAHARNSRRTFSHAKRRLHDENVIVSTSLEGDASMTISPERLSKMRKTKHSCAIDPSFHLPNGVDSEELHDFEASKQQLLAFDDWLGLGITDDPNTNQRYEHMSRSPSHGKRRKKGECPPVVCKSFSRGANPQDTPSAEENVSIRVGTDALVTSPARVDGHMRVDKAVLSDGTRRLSTHIQAKSEQQKHDLSPVTQQTDPPRTYPSTSHTSRHAASTTSSVEVLFDQPCHDSNRDAIRNQSDLDAELYMLSDPPEEPTTARGLKTVPTQNMLSRSKGDISDGTMHQIWDLRWSPAGHSIDRKMEATGASPHQGSRPHSLFEPSHHDCTFETVESLVPTNQQEPCTQIATHLPETRPASPNSLWKRFIFGPGSPTFDNADLLHSSPTRQSESTSQLSLAARVSSSSSPHHPTQGWSRTDTETLNKLSMVAQPGRARTREAVEISSCASSDVEDSETESDLDE